LPGSRRCPKGWPGTLQLGLTESPGDTSGPYGFRYQYLAGGVNTGSGWSTWNPDGTFASMYAAESWKHGKIPVLTYYMLLQSKPGGGDEAQADLGNLRNADTMTAYWGRRAPALPADPLDEDGGRPRRARPLGLPRAGERDGARLGVRPAVGEAAGRARAQRDPRLAHERLGTKHDVVYEDPPDATVRAYAAQSAAFYRSLHARFDISFEDFSDRDAGFYEVQQGNPKTWFTAADFHSAPAVRADLRAARGNPDGRLADPARQHEAAEHLGQVPRQPRRVAARRLEGAPAGVRETPVSSLSSSAAAPTGRRASRPTAATSRRGPPRSTAAAR